MTLLVASIFAEALEQVVQTSARAFEDGSDAVELRLDGYEGEPEALAGFLRSRADRTWIVTCRSAEEGGHFRGDTMERVSRLLGVARGTNAYVDFEFADWERSANIRQKVLLAATSSAGPKLILSFHDFEKRPADLEERVGRMLRVPQAVAKVAYRGQTATDSFAALDLMHRHGGRVIAIDMGDGGTWTRVLAKKLGAFATYASLDGQAGTAPGQITLRDMHSRFRWDRIRGSSRVFGVIGDPVEHSLSPLLFNRWFTETDADAVYVPWRVQGRTSLQELLEAFGTPQVARGATVARPWLDVSGFSVTIPHKETALGILGETADPLARRIGAVNTIAFGDGRTRGFNTDCYAASASLALELGCAPIDLVGTTVDVLGAGGSARAVVEGLMDFGCRVTVYARSRERAVSLAAGRSIELRPWEDRMDRRGDVLIHCTPLGLWPRVDESPMPASALRGCRLVFDLIYNPLETRLLRDARSAGCLTLCGLDMFVRQAGMQFELWMGHKADCDAGKMWVESKLQSDSHAPPKQTPLGPPSPRGEVRRRIVFIGMRGVGKTTVGRELARRLGADFLDTDEEVERRAGRSITAIFADEGEAGFRRREAEVVREIAMNPPGVLSLGGGAVLDGANVSALRTFARFVWLRAPAEVLWKRISRDSRTASGRPALSALAGLEELRQLLESRESIYRALSDRIIDTDDRTPTEIAAELGQQG